MIYKIPLPAFLAAMFFVATLVMPGCRKEDNYIFDVNSISAEPQGISKDFVKSDHQYISILYANLFQKALSANDLVEIIDLIESVGDKETIHEVIISSFMNAPDKIIPTDQEMRDDLDKFVLDTYKRFLVRNPTQAEITWFKNFIEANPKVSPELVYMAFALSDEYIVY